MKQISRALLGLTLTASVAGGLVFFALRTAELPAPKSIVSASRAFDFDKERVFAIEIRKGGQTIRIERNDSGWFVRSPVYMQAAEEKIAELIEYLLDLRPEIPWEATEAASITAESGLSNAEAETSVRLWSAQDIPIAAVQFGRQSGYNQKHYASFKKANDDPTLGMVSSATVEKLLPTLQSVLERRVLGVGHQQVLRLKVRIQDEGNEKPGVDLERVSSASSAKGAEFEYVVHMPQAIDADPQRAGDVLRAFSATPVARFLSFAHEKRLDEYELDPAAIEVEAEIALRDHEGKPRKEIRRLHIGQPRTNAAGISTLWVARDSPPWVGEINAALYYALKVSPADLVSTRILRFDSRKVYGVEVEDRGQRLEFERISEKGSIAWLNVSSKERVARDKMQKLLFTFSDLSGQARIYPGAAEDIDTWLRGFGFSRTQSSRVVFWDSHKSILAELRLGRVDGATRYVRPANANWVAQVPQVKLQALPGYGEDFSSRSP